MKQLFYFKFILLSLLMVVMGLGNAYADKYQLYSGEITEGDYILVSPSSTPTAMNTTVDKNRLQFQAVEVKDGIITRMNNHDIDLSSVVWKIKKSGDYYTLYNVSADKYAASTGKENQAQLLADGTNDMSLWTITGTETYEFVNKKNAALNINKNLRKNSSYGFACYSTKTGNALSLYKKVIESPLASITVDGVTPNPVFHQGDVFVFGGMVTATYENGDSKDVTTDATFSGYDMSTAGDQTVTVSYTEGGVTKTTTYNITVKDVEATFVTVEPSEVTIVKGSTSQLTATVGPDNATDKTVNWSSSDEDVATVSSDGVVTAVAAGNAVITAKANGGADDVKSECAVTVVNELVYDTYTMVKDDANLAAGDKVIIVNTNAKKAMSTTQNSNNRGATDVTIEDNKAKVPSTKDIQVFTLEGDANGWYFNTGSGYIYAASKSSNHLKTQTTKNDNAKAVITITDNKTSVIFQREGSNVLQYNPNNGNPIFSCYASASQQPVEIYKQEDEKPKPSISFAETVVEITYGDNYDKQQATVEEGYSGKLEYSSDNEDVVKFHGNNVIDILKAGTVTITATAPATDTTSESSASYTLKINEPADPVEGATLALDEHFNDCESERPDPDNFGDKGWNGTNDFKALPETCNWTVEGTAEPAGNGCLKLGTSTDAGDATSPSFTLNGKAPLSFDIAPWTSTSDGSITGAKSVTITLTNAKFEDGMTTKTVGGVEGQPFQTTFEIGWNHYEFNITGSGEGDVAINFHGSSQFFLDNVVVGGGAQPAHEINLTFSSAGYLTWVATADIDFEATEGVTAYQITEATPQGITAEEVKKAPKDAALLLKGSGKVQLTRTSDVAPLQNNKMQACTDASVTGITGSATSTNIYVLGNGGNGLGFYMLKNTLQAGKGYLIISGDAGAKATFIGFEETEAAETTGISDYTVPSTEDDNFYNLQGVRVVRPQKGIYIKNGKKMIIK